MKVIQTLLTIVIVLSAITVKAQKTDKAQVVVQYNFKHVIDTTQRDHPMTKPYALILGTNMSRYDDYYSVMWERGTPIQTSMIDPSSGKVLTGSVASAGGEQYIKDISENKLTAIAYLGGTWYAIEDELPKMDWKVVSEQKTIKDYICQKATTFFRGRNYTTWFTDQLPYRNGPWKLGGLPGLILEANDDKNEVIFECIGIALASDYKPIKVPGDAILVDPVKFKKTQDAINNDAKALIGASALRSSNISAGSVRIPGTEGMKPRVFNNPVEK